MEIENINPSSKTQIRFLWFLFMLFIIEQMSSMYWVLSQMSTTGKQFPLQVALGKITPVYTLIDSFLTMVFFGPLFDLFFREYIWGGFTMATCTYVIILWIKNDYTFAPLPEELKRNWRLNLMFGMIVLSSIIYGFNRDQWVPYVLEPSWEINMVHKQQLSAGTFLIFYIMILSLSCLPSSWGYLGARRFLSSKWIGVYIFFCFSVDNAASFSSFPGVGYEEIFLYGQNFWSIDKLFHFLMSSALIVVLLTFAEEKKFNRMLLLAVWFTILWELFEISLNPREASDSLLDMVFNTSAIIFSGVIFTNLQPISAEFQEQNVAKQ